MGGSAPIASITISYLRERYSEGINAVIHGTRKEQTMTTHDLAVALAKQLEEEGVTDEELERIIHDAKEEARKEIARIIGADDENV